MSVTRWQIMEEWIDHWESQYPHAPFACRDVANSIGITNPEATGLIQAYQHEQWRPDSESAFVIKRSGRTRNALWSVGERRSDMKQINLTFYEDMVVKASRAFEPSLQRIRALNPKLGDEVEQVLDGTLKGAFQVMKAALRV